MASAPSIEDVGLRYPWGKLPMLKRKFYGGRSNTMDLSNSLWGDRQIGCFLELLSLERSVVHLHLNNNSIRDGDLSKIVEYIVDNNRNIKSIHLRDNRITKHGVPFLTPILEVITSFRLPQLPHKTHSISIQINASWWL